MNPGGNSFQLHQSESSFEKEYVRRGGEADPARLGGYVEFNKYGHVPASRNEQNANLDTRAAHEIGHYFGLEDNGGDGDLMNYEERSNIVQGYNRMKPAKADVIRAVGKKWRRIVRKTDANRVKVTVHSNTVTVIQ